MSVIAFIQARVGSTRLPGKVLMDLHGKPVLTRVIERVQKARGVDSVIVVTTIEAKDLPLVRLCAERGVQVFCGSENDVLDRFYQAARLLKPDHVVRITADCPVLDPGLVDQVVQRHIRSRADYTANVLVDRFPDGEDVEVLTFASLERAWAEAALPSEREHVTPYIRKHPEQFRLESFLGDADHSRERWTLDTARDYDFLSALYARLAPTNEFFGIDEILSLLREEPALRERNAGIARNEGYQKSLREDTRRA
jgi:spore coat polysaccharide biosynthesis protein SpsF (cytidylyltransferase family)